MFLQPDVLQSLGGGSLKDCLVIFEMGFLPKPEHLFFYIAINGKTNIKNIWKMAHRRGDGGGAD